MPAASGARAGGNRLSDRRAMSSAPNASATACKAHTAIGKLRGGESYGPAATTVGVTRDRVGGAMIGAVGERDNVSVGVAPGAARVAG